MCGVSFGSREEKEEHLRLHCVICKILFESRDELFGHIKENHPAGPSGGVFWELERRAEESEEGLSEDELDLIEYCRERLNG